MKAWKGTIYHDSKYDREFIPFKGIIVKDGYGHTWDSGSTYEKTGQPLLM